MSKDLLFELGTEEIPPAYLPQVAGNLCRDVEKDFEENRLNFDRSILFYTPRRLAVIVEGLAEKQPDRLERHRGPSADVGLQEDGSYALPAEKFAEGHGSTPDQLILEETDSGRYLFVEVEKKGITAEEVVPELLVDLVQDIDQPEKMRWDDSGLEFIRPIRWVTCLYGNKTLQFNVGGVESGKYTKGHRFHGEESIEISSPEDYERKLTENHVIPDPDQRRRVMDEKIRRKTEELGAKVAVDDDFFEILINSLEYPSIIDGSFPEEFLKLPAELLFKTLTGEAKLVPLVGRDTEEPLSLFVGFRDGIKDRSGKIKQGYESVINARLRDSKFFFEHDREVKLESFLPKLKEVTFQEKLGSIADKVERMRKLATEIGNRADLKQPELVDRTVELCKADLVTEVVDEFPSLEGTIGAHYAQLDGEPDEVVTGIKEHYRPRSSGDNTPGSQTGAVASISDKLDTLAGSFLIGEEPTGTRDPYGLRRKADGVIRTLIDREMSLNLHEVIGLSSETFDCPEDRSFEGRLKDYFRDRTGSVLEQVYGIDYDVVDAVMVNFTGDPFEIFRRARSLQGFKDKPELKRLVDSFTRVMNILGEKQQGKVDKELMELDEELALWEKTAEKRSKFEKLTAENHYDEIIQHLLDLKDPIDEYFDNVMVMSDDEKKRENRLGLLSTLRELFMNVGDLSRIITD